MKFLFVLSLCSVCFFNSITFAQNLVPNPSFEDIISCPQYIGEFNVVDWYSPNTASPDLFHSCSISNAGVPQNAFGWQYPNSGYAYVGGHTSDFGGNDAREYIQCQLINPLIVGEDYEVMFYVSRTDSSTKACDNLGAYFSVNPITSSNIFYFNVVPQVLSKPNTPITNDTGWVQIIDTITANSNFQYLTIGVFTDDANTNWVPVQGGWESEAHYYYDDVSVKQVTTNSIHENQNIQVSIYPNPSSSTINIKSDNNIKQYIIYSLLGKVTSIVNDLNTTQHQISLENYSAGIYYLDIQVEKSVIRKRLIIHP